eukprot:gnl/MRDRNA2_/MRDRNA2_104594_c0_seq1.p1 gnl/MRDRNA2_/MRDRNA2_104594_c0~~gnl/MRDRNA2_/MRDRNA2_104594_c0_seq1.p1  ORF type:complete len:162 (-),score=57.41 gnl/MRDRNA2_/MRDRNA2_104594_c0_seq1:22-507(-)
MGKDKKKKKKDKKEKKKKDKKKSKKKKSSSSSGSSTDSSDAFMKMKKRDEEAGFKYLEEQQKRVEQSLMAGTAKGQAGKKDKEKDAGSSSGPSALAAGPQAEPLTDAEKIMFGDIHGAMATTSKRKFMYTGYAGVPEKKETKEEVEKKKKIGPGRPMPGAM